MVLPLILGVVFVFISSLIGLIFTVKKFRKLVKEFQEEFNVEKAEIDCYFEDKGQ